MGVIRSTRFHLVLPSLPGHGFSDKPAETGWSLPRIADAWAELMRRIGYGERWAAQGGDWGAEVAATIGSRQPAGCIGIHLNGLDWTATDAEMANADAQERLLIERKKRFRSELAEAARARLQAGLRTAPDEW